MCFFSCFSPSFLLRLSSIIFDYLAAELRVGAREYFAASKISLTSRSDVTHSARLRRATFLSRKGSVALDFVSARLAAAHPPAPSCGRTSSGTSCHLPLKGKALVRINILPQHNKGNAKSNFDHRNSYFAVTLAVGAATAPRRGGNTHRKCEVEFRPSEFNFTAMLAAGAATAPRRGGNTHRRCLGGCCGGKGDGRRRSGRRTF